MDMMDEFGLENLNDLRDFIFSNSLRATLEQIKDLPAGSYHNE
jgi:N-methylhydantoinase B